MKLVAMFLLFVPAVAAAAGDVHHGQAGPTTAQWKLLGFTVINFCVFVVAMNRLARTPLRDFLRTRRKQIVGEMEEARRLKDDAERLKREIEAKAARLDQDRAELIAEVRAIAEADREKALREASEAAERMRRDAERTADSDLARAKEELRAEAARLAAELAAAEVRRRVTEDDRKRLLSEFLSGVGKQ
jgi:F0F1-type ATP synthase membrane subunit b/b'